MSDDPKTLVEMVATAQAAPDGDPWLVLLAFARLLDEMNAVLPEAPEKES